MITEIHCLKRKVNSKTYTHTIKGKSQLTKIYFYPRDDCHFLGGQFSNKRLESNEQWEQLEVGQGGEMDLHWQLKP